MQIKKEDQEIKGDKNQKIKVEDSREVDAHSYVMLINPQGFSFNQIKQEEYNSWENQYFKDQGYFLHFFSPKQTAESIQRKNQNLEMINFENCEEEPDDVYNRRKKKVTTLLTKEQELLDEIRILRNNDFTKYLAIIQFVKFFCQIKDQLPGIRTDYYSNKTFCAIKNSSESQIFMATQVAKKILTNVINQNKIYNQSNNSSQIVSLEEKFLQFLIIPRFLISRQKINKFIKNQNLQQNFQFLILHECLGHYNNEANKKLPEQKQMNLVKDLLLKSDGRQKFKKICSINHGNKFLIKYPMDYYQLYYKNLDYLKYLDSSFKKGKKYEIIKKDLQKNILKTTEQSLNNSSKSASIFSQSQSNSTGKNFSLHNLQRALNKMEIDEQIQEEVNPLSQIPKKKLLKKLNTLPEKQDNEQIPQQRFKVKKYASQNKTENIILIQPPSEL